jgi:cupin 2 domain-containing protein
VRGEPGEVPSGHLAGQVPVTGESFHDLAAVGPVRVEHIVSSETPDPAEQVQDWDEWVLVIAGSAELEIAGRRRVMDAGDWVLLPAGTPHRVRRTERGTQWIAVHGPRPAEAGADGR